MQRWTRGDDGSRADSQSGTPGTADALYRADAPLHGGQPACLLRGAGWDEGARSGWSHEGDVRAASGGQPSGAASETAPTGVPAPTGAPGRDSQGGWHDASVGNQLHGRQDRAGADETAPGVDL